LETLESQRDQHNAAASGGSRAAQRELPLFAPASAPAVGLAPALHPAPAEPVAAADPVRVAVEAIDPDELSPKAALETLYRLRKLLSSDGA
jgi:DNA mismatch repair protein MutS